MSWRIHPKGGGPAVRLVRDVRHAHPAWVHAQMGTRSEGDLQARLDQYNAEIARGLGPDFDGVEWVEENE